jgi:hypothetical protein
MDLFVPFLNQLQSIDRLLQRVHSGLRINHRSTNIGITEQPTDCVKVHATRDEDCGKRMTKRVQLESDQPCAPKVMGELPVLYD